MLSVPADIHYLWGVGYIVPYRFVSSTLQRYAQIEQAPNNLCTN
nr:MAG TPA: hypothetical protein [Caudoviricetes sp.]